jgi:hypothetical protein
VKKEKDMNRKQDTQAKKTMLLWQPAAIHVKYNSWFRPLALRLMVSHSLPFSLFIIYLDMQLSGLTIFIIYIKFI